MFAVAADAVELHAERVDEEQVRAAAIVEGVEHDPDEIVVAERLALGERRADLVRLAVARDKDDVQVIVVVGQVRRRLLARGNAVPRLALDERRDGRLVRTRRAVEVVLERRWRGHAWNRDRLGNLRRRRRGLRRHRHGGPREQTKTQAGFHAKCRSQPDPGDMECV